MYTLVRLQMDPCINTQQSPNYCQIPLALSHVCFAFVLMIFWIQYVLLIYFCIVIIIFRNGHFCIVMNQGKLLTGVKMLCLYSVEKKSLEKGNRKTKGKLLTGVKMLCLYSVEKKSLEKGNRKTKGNC